MKTKPKKRTFLGDTFEQLSDTATSTVKQTGTSVKKTFNPLDVVSNEEEVRKQEAVKEARERLEKKEKNHTPIDLKDFEDKYNKQDEQKKEELRQRLFKLVKEGEKEAYETKKKKEEERKKKEEEEEEKKKKKKEDEKKRKQEEELPKGKQRRSLFSPRRKARQQHAEYKPSAGQG